MKTFSHLVLPIASVLGLGLFIWYIVLTMILPAAACLALIQAEPIHSTRDVATICKKP